MNLYQVLLGLAGGLCIIGLLATVVASVSESNRQRDIASEKLTVVSAKADEIIARQGPTRDEMLRDRRRAVIDFKLCPTTQNLNRLLLAHNMVCAFSTDAEAKPFHDEMAECSRIYEALDKKP